MSFVVGITGGIGSGKSAVTKQLESLGIVIVDADVVAREVVEPGQPALAEIVKYFGDHIVSYDGKLDRAALRKIVFESDVDRKVLESITHPRIRESIQAQLAAAQSPYVVLSSPLLLESGQASFANYVVVVDTSEATQIQRTMLRDNNDESLVQKIMAAQLPRMDRVMKADHVLDNNGTLQHLEEQVTALHRDLLALAQQHA